MNDYLWDRSGMPDPEIQHLESLLSEFRHEDRPLIFPAEPAAITAAAGGASCVRFWQKGWVGGLSFLRLLQKGWDIPRLAAAAVVLLALSASIFLMFRPSTRPPDSGPGWDVSSLQGAPQIGSQIVSADHSAIKLHVGQTLTTNSSSRATLSENDLGQIEVDPNSRLRLLQSGPNRKRIQLEVGTIHAAIWAPPTQFVVDTPSAVAVDLGCAYTLQVGEDGSGTIRTTLGWVGFHLNGRDSFIPAGAMCSTRPKIGPGSPYFEDAAPAFREALASFGNAFSPAASNSQTDSSSHALDVVLREARAKDALTLWHLLSRTNGPERAKVYDRLAVLVPPPSGITRDGVLALNPQMLDLYWNALGLGDISIWRFWEQSSTPSSSASPRLQKKQPLFNQPGK